MDRKENYRTVTACVVKVRPQSILARHPKTAKELTIPRSLINGADDLKLERLDLPGEFTFRVFAWKAEALGLA
jgi:hypothetical protein